MNLYLQVYLAVCSLYLLGYVLTSEVRNFKGAILVLLSVVGIFGWAYGLI